MVNESTKLFLALGDGVKRIEGNEQATCIVQKRGLYLVRDVQVDALLTADDVVPLRPRSENGFEPWQLDQLIGRRVAKSLREGTLLQKGDIEL